MSNFEFLYPQAFWLVIPVLILLTWIKSSSASSQMIAKHLANAMRDKVPQKKWSYVWPSIFSALLIIALAGPSFENKTFRPLNLLMHAC